MVKLTMIGRVSDGLPLVAQSTIRYVNDKSFSSYKQQGELLLKEIFRGALLASSNMSIWIDHHCFNFLVENGVCFMALCDSSYPRKLTFHYLQDLQKEFHKLNFNGLILNITTPYSFVQFDSVIRDISKQYIDTRTDANLSKLKADHHGQHLDVITEHISEIMKRRANSEISETTINTTPGHQTANTIWGSHCLEMIAAKWTPITIIVLVIIVVIRASLVLTNDFLIT